MVNPITEPLSEQVNIRLTRRDYDIVRALIFLDDDKGSATDVLRTIVQRHLAEQAQDDDVARALELLARRRAKQSGTLQDLRGRARRGQSA